MDLWGAYNFVREIACQTVSCLSAEGAQAPVAVLHRGNRAKSEMRSPQWFPASSLGTQAPLVQRQEGKSGTG